jgi:hypothetical protein
MRTNRLSIALFVLFAGCSPTLVGALQATIQAAPSPIVSQSSFGADTAVPPVPCNTIADGPDEDGFLACVYGSLKGKVFIEFDTPQPPQQNNIQQAVHNLAGCSPKLRTDGMVIGHGGSGYVRMGKGNLFLDATKFLADLESANPPWNRSTWIQVVPGINTQNNFNSIILFACETGAGKDGALLLNDLAAATNTSVLAPTSLVKCNRTSGELSLLGGEFNEAKPGSAAQVKQKPQISRNDKVPESNEIKLPTNTKGEYLRIPLSSIKLICICQFPSPTHPQGGKSRCFDASKHQHWLVSNIFFTAPFQPPYIIGADVTGYIEITFGGEREEKIRLNILNDELLEEPKTHTYYYVTATFEQSWAGLD